MEVTTDTAYIESTSTFESKLAQSNAILVLTIIQLIMEVHLEVKVRKGLFHQLILPQTK
jgi:hypothetical protein